MKPIRIVLADDHDLVRAGLCALLHRIADFEVAGEAQNGRQALQQIKQHRPDVVLMDIMMPELNGLDATAKVTTTFPAVHVVMLSMNSSEDSVLAALRAGATGYLLKNITPAELELAIRAVARGEMYLSSGVSKHVVRQCLDRVASQSGSFDRLTPRQREVLQLVAEGCSAKEIAQKLGLRARTVESHRAQIMEALDIHNIAGLVRYAIRMGLVSVEPEPGFSVRGR